MDKITLILGAGASQEVGLPVGIKLKSEIANLLNVGDGARYDTRSTSPEVLEAFRVFGQQRANLHMNPYFDACRQIREAMPQAISIDNYLDAHVGDEFIEITAKISIAKAILDAERRSKIYIDQNTRSRMFNFENVENTWFNRFFQLLTENCRIQDLAERLARVKVISFNYDRSFLHFMNHALQNYFGIDQNDSVALLSDLKIFHPYGKVGRLPWQTDGGYPVSYGANVNGVDLYHLTSQIRTFTEGTDPKSSNIKSLRQCLVDSERLVFLGFAYHKLNMELIGSNQKLVAPQIAFGTAYKISTPNLHAIEEDVRKLVGKAIKSIHIRTDLTCENLFLEYWRTMSMVK